MLLGGLGYSIWLPLGPTAALYLFAASRDEADPWTRRSTGMVVALLAAYLGATGVGSGVLPWTELLHTGLAWAVAWFAGERTRLRREQIAELKERALRADREASGNAAWRWPRSGPGSPATSTTPPDTRST